MEMPGRKYGTAGRYGFNGKERDKDISNLTAYDYGFRIYNPALGKFLSVDPLTQSYPWYTPYQFAGNTPIQAIDIDGAEPQGYSLSNSYVASHPGTGVKFISSNYDGQVYNHKKLGIVTAYAIQDIDNKCYLIFESAMGGSKQFWYREYNKDGWKGNVNSFAWETPPDPSNVLYAMTVGPLVALPAAIAGAFGLSAVAATVGTQSVNVATKALLTYWRYAPLIGAAGQTLAEFLDESGSAGVSNAARFAKLTAAEKVVVKRMIETGRNVELLSPTNVGKTADFIIDGVKTELKSSSGEAFNINTAVTQIQDAFKQGTNALIDTRKFDVSSNQIKEIFERVQGSYRVKGQEVPGKIEVWTQEGIYKF
jgi:RHS repeat-associated protein